MVAHIRAGGEGTAAAISGAGAVGAPPCCGIGAGGTGIAPGTWARPTAGVRRTSAMATSIGMRRNGL